MSIMQIVMTSALLGGEPIPATYNFNDADYPWNTASGSYPFAGTSFTITGSLGSVSNIAINFWFRPSSLSNILLSELGSPFENTGYHYSMVEINSSGHLRSRIWDDVGANIITSTTTVTLNGWNHLYLSYSSGTLSMSLNNDTPVSTSVIRSAPPTTYIGVGTYDTTYITTTNRFIGEFSDLRISTAGAGSNYSSTRATYGV